MSFYDPLKTFFVGAMGAVTFGSYSQYQNMETIKLNNQSQAEIMRLNNELQETKTKLLIDEMKKEILNTYNICHAEQSKPLG